MEPNKETLEIIQQLSLLINEEIPFSPEIYNFKTCYAVDKNNNINALSICSKPQLSLHEITNILQGISSITSLHLNNNQIQDIKPLEKLTQLKSLDLKDNLIHDINSLEKLSQLISLDLSENPTQDIQSLGQLVQLTDLYLSFNHISDIKPIETLTKLKHLSVINCQVKDISPLERLTQLTQLYLYNNKIQNIDALEKLTKLIHLDLYGNQIQEINPLEKLTQLATLDLAFNEIENIKPIENLIGLKKIDIYDNNIRDISPLRKLKQITTLDLSNNFVQSIIPLEKLTKISYLNLSYNKIKDINPIANLPQLEYLSLSGNEIEDIVFPEDENHVDLVKEYFKRQSSGNTSKTPLHILQLMVVGNGEAGKTSVLRTLRSTLIRLQKKKQTDIQKLPTGSTHGNVHYYWDASTGSTKKYLLVKDFGGQEYYHHFHPVFYHAQALYWIVTTPKDASNNNNPENGKFTPGYWHENIRHSLRYFHKEEKEDINAWLLLNKADQQTGNIDTSALPDFQKFFTLVSQEPVKGANLLAAEHLYYSLMEYMEAASAKEQVYDFSKKIFENLNTISDKDKENHISFTVNEFRDFLKKRKVLAARTINNNIATIINDLRLLGLCIYIQGEDAAKDLIYLFPQQLTDSVFKHILNKNVKEGIEGKQRGIIPVKNFRGRDKLKDLLEHFEVIFQDGDTGDWVAPQFLPKNFDDTELLGIASNGIKEKITLRFNNYMPKGIMSRLIAYFGKNPNKKWYWRDGILFTHKLSGNRSKALIKARWENFEIDIEAETIEDLEKIYRKVLLSYFNKPIQDEDEQEIIDDNASSLKPDSGIHIKEIIRLRKVYSLDYIDMCISLNNGPFIPTAELKTRVEAEEPVKAFEWMTKMDSDKLKLKTTLIKTYDYLPFIKHIMDTQKLEAMSKPKKIFISYSHDDGGICTKIISHISLLERQGYISHWVDKKIDAGSQWNDEIEKQIREADIVLLLMSDSFFASEYIWTKEMEIINEQQKANKLVVVPILCRHCLWHVRPQFKDILDKEGRVREDLPSFQALPMKGGRLYPIHSDAFKYVDEAYEIIAQKLHELITK